MSGLISSVYSRGPRTRSPQQETDDVQKARAAAWHKLGLVILDPNEIHDDWVTQAVINEAESLYGKRKQDA